MCWLNNMTLFVLDMTPNDAELAVIDIVIKQLVTMAKTVKNTKVKDYLEVFNKLPYSSKCELICIWLDSQNLAVAKSISAGLPIMVPAFGTFCVNHPSVVFNQLKTDIANEYGYDSYRECPFDIKQKVNNLAKDKLKEQQEARREYRENRKEEGTLGDVNITLDLLQKLS